MRECATTSDLKTGGDRHTCCAAAGSFRAFAPTGTFCSPKFGSVSKFVMGHSGGSCMLVVGSGHGPNCDSLFYMSKPSTRKPCISPSIGFTPACSRNPYTIGMNSR